MAKELDPLKLSSPRIFLFRMLVFVILGGLVAFLLYKQIQVAFMANPGLNALIIGVLFIGIVLSVRQVIRLYPEIAWVNDFRLADPGLAVDRPPVLLAPMAAILGSRVGRMAMSAQLMRGILDSIATRLDEARDISRYMTGLLVFLGLLGTFWGLIETVSSVGNVIQGLKPGGDAGSHVRTRCARASPRRSAAWAFRSRPRCSVSPARWCSASSICNRARRRTASTPNWKTGFRPRSTTMPASRCAGAGVTGEVRGAIERLRDAVDQAGSGKAASTAMANLAEAIQGLVHHMRTEQQMIRDWVDGQAEQQREIKKLLEVMVRENVDR